MSHIHDEDLRLAAGGLLTGADLVSVNHHIADCRECRERGLRLLTADDPPFQEVEELIQEAESSPVSIETMLPRLERAAATLELTSRVVPSRKLQILRGRVMFVQSWLLRCAGATNAAIRTAQEAKALFRAEGHEFQLGRAALAESIAFAEKGDSESASAAASEAQVLFERLGDLPRAYMARSAHAHALANAGRLLEARRIYEYLLREAQLTPNSRTAFQLTLAVLMVRMGDLDGVDGLIAAAEAGPSERIAPQFPYRIRSLRAIVLARRGQIEAAIDILDQLYQEGAKEGFGRDVILTRCMLADLLTALGRHDEALPHALAALDYFSREGVGTEFLRSIAMSVVREEMLRNASNVYRDLVRVRTPATPRAARPTSVA